jgi:hypothetical protein
MTKQFSIPQIILWLFVIALGIELGAGLYETLVVMPAWTSAIPDSVIGYYQHNAANPKFALNAGGRFWMIATPSVGLFALLTLLTSFKTRAEHRKWRLLGGGLALIVVIATFAWFVPNIIKLFSEGVLTIGRDEVASLANWWVRLNWVRVVVYSAGWLSALRALSIPAKGGDIE